MSWYTRLFLERTLRVLITHAISDESASDAALSHMIMEHKFEHFKCCCASKLLFGMRGARNEKPGATCSCHK